MKRFLIAMAMIVSFLMAGCTSTLQTSDPDTKENSSDVSSTMIKPTITTKNSTLSSGTTLYPTDAPLVLPPKNDHITNILVIGNSCAYYFMDELEGMAAAAGYQVNVYNAYYSLSSGNQVDAHWSNLTVHKNNLDKNSYEFYKTANGSRKKLSQSITLEGAINYTEWDVIVMNESVRPRKADTYASMYKNTVEDAKRVYDYMKENDIGMLLSIDGAKATQDYNRPFHNGKGSFDVIEPLIPKILEINPSVTFRMTTIPATCHHIFENISYAIEKGFSNFFIIPNYFETWDNEHREILQKEMHKYTEYYIETCQTGKHPITFSIFEDCFRDIKKINRAIVQKTYRAECGACTKCGLGASMFASIHPNGNVYSCQEMTSNEGADSMFCIGNIYTGMKNEKRKALIEMFDSKPVKGEYCESCRYNRICNGECVAQNYFINGDINYMPEMNCWWKRFLLDEAIYVANVLGEEENQIFKQRWDNAK